MLPLPPLPPDTPPAQVSAPLPRTDNSAPPEAVAEGPSVGIKLYRNRPYDPGVGFAPGSRYQSAEDRKPIQTPGLGFRVPLH
jgi:hypothetical protein